MLDLYFLEEWIFKVKWPYLNYNHLINSLKIPTKIWRCHVMFLNHFYTKISFIHVIFWALHSIFLLWSRVQFCTTTHLNISLKLLPKLGEVSRSILFHIIQKSSAVLWKYWVNQPHFHSVPTSSTHFWILFHLFYSPKHFCQLF